MPPVPAAPPASGPPSAPATATGRSARAEARSGSRICPRGKSGNGEWGMGRGEMAARAGGLHSSGAFPLPHSPFPIPCFFHPRSATSTCRTGTPAPPYPLQPALLPREAVGLDAVADAELADGFGQVVADRALREVQLAGDVGGAGALAGEAQHLALAVVERVGLAPGLHRQFRRDGAAAAGDLAQRVGELAGGRV